jgi:Leucine-rich repeat (LRR) protein
MGIINARKIINTARTENSETLDLSLLELTTEDLVKLIPEIAELSNLTELNIFKNPFTALPESINQLSNLTVLDLSDTELTTLPESLFRLPNLALLDVSGNSLESLSESIGLLTNLTELTISGNNLKTLPGSIDQLVNLTKLIVAGNRLTIVPESIFSLPNLTELRIIGNSFETLPEFREGDLLNLTNLIISGNSFRTLPDSIGKLSKLTTLHLSDTAIRDLPETLGNLQGLEELFFHNAPLSDETMIWLDDTFAGRVFYNMAAHSRNQSVEDVLKAIYADKDEQELVMESLENCDLDPGIIVYGEDYRMKPAIELIKEFLGNVQIHNKYERELYGPPLRNTLKGVLNKELFSKEERTLNMAKMSVHMGDCSTPVREGLMLEAVKQLLAQEDALSEMNQHIIEREAVRNSVNKLEGFDKNEKIEQANGFVNCIYAEGAEKDKDNPNVRIIGDRDRLPSTTSYRGFAFRQIQNKPELIKNFACLVCQTVNNNEPIQTDGMYHLDGNKIKNIKVDFISELGFGTKEQQEQKKYLNQYSEEMNDLLHKQEELYTEYFNDAQDLLDIPSHKKELKELLAKQGIVVKGEYEKYFAKKKSEIEMFMDKKKNPKADLDKFTTPVNLNERKNSRSESPDSSKEKQAKAIRPTPRQ